jgi:hypothetical protein
MKGKIRVFCRLRPLNNKEQSLDEKIVVFCPDAFTISHPCKDDNSKDYIYDHVFDANATQEEVFEDTKVEILFSILKYRSLFMVRFKKAERGNKELLVKKW